MSADQTVVDQMANANIEGKVTLMTVKRGRESDGAESGRRWVRWKRALYYTYMLAKPSRDGLEYPRGTYYGEDANTE
jgi:hypothetical protein